MSIGITVGIDNFSCFTTRLFYYFSLIPNPTYFVCMWLKGFPSYIGDLVGHYLHTKPNNIPYIYTFL